MQIKQEANSYLLTFVTGRGRELKRFARVFPASCMKKSTDSQMANGTLSNKG